MKKEMALIAMNSILMEIGREADVINSQVNIGSLECENGTATNWETYIQDLLDTILHLTKKAMSFAEMVEILEEVAGNEQS